MFLEDQVVVIGGDFSNRNPAAAFEAIGEMQQVPSGPTWAGLGRNRLVHIFHNTSIIYSA